MFEGLVRDYCGQCGTAIRPPRKIKNIYGMHA